MLTNRYTIWAVFAVGLWLRGAASSLGLAHSFPHELLAKVGIEFTPDLLAFVVSNFHTNNLVEVWFIILLDLGTAALIFYTAQHRFEQRIAAILAYFWIFYPPAIFNSVQDPVLTISAFLLTAIIVAYGRLENSNWSGLHSVLLGALLGLSVLVAEWFLIVALAVLIYIVLIRFETARKLRIASASMVLATLLLIILPVLLYNAEAKSYFSLNTYSGWSVYVGNHSGSDGSAMLTEATADSVSLARQTESGRDALALHYGLDYIVTHRHEAVELWPRKFAELWKSDLYLMPKLSSAVNHPIADFVLLISLVLPVLTFVLMGAAGFFLHPHWPTRGLLILVLFLAGVLCMFTYGDPREHHALIPCLIISCGAVMKNPVWKVIPEWRRLFYLVTAGIFVGITLRDVINFLRS